jgi:outer membrane protein, heavy metal efflux system
MLLAFALATALGTALGGSASPAAADPPPLTIKQAIALARARSPFRAGAAAVAEGTSEAARVAGRPLNPVVEFRTENWRPGASTSLPLDVWVVVSQPVELGGKREIRRAIAAAERDSAAASLSLVDRQLAMRVTTLYFQALRARATVSTLTAAGEGFAILVDTMRQRADEGYAAESDLLRFRAEAARVEIDIARAQLELARSLDELTAVVGLPARIVAAQLVVPESIAPPEVSGSAISAAIDGHPEVTAATARITRAEQSMALEHARRIPDPAVTTGFKQTMGIGTIVAAVTTSLPLFDRNNTARANAVGELRAAAAERDAARTRLTSATTTLLETARALAERSRRARVELLEPSEGVRAAAHTAFEEGAADVLKVIDAERVYADVNRIALDLQLEATSTAIAARIALGEEPLP